MRVVADDERPHVARRRLLRNSAIGRIADDGRRVVAGDVNKGFVDEDIRCEESLQIGTTIGDTHLLHPLVVRQHSALEVVEVHVARLAPPQLGDGHHAWESHIEHPFTRGHPLRPEVSLHAEHEILLLVVERCRCGVETVDVAHDLCIFLVVEVEHRVRRADDVVAMTGGFFKG